MVEERRSIDVRTQDGLLRRDQYRILDLENMLVTSGKCNISTNI